MKVLVTGVAGFIGYHVCQRLLERGDEVVGIDNLNDYYDVGLKVARLEQLGIELPKGYSLSDDRGFGVGRLAKGDELNVFKSNQLTFIKVDIADKEGMARVFTEHKFDAVCHLAAQAGVRYSIDNPHAYIDSNIVGFLNVLEGCRHYDVKNLCFASSSSVYGLNTAQPFSTQDHTDHPISLYAATKKSNEMMAHTYAHLYGIRTTGLRFFTVYGPWGRPDMAPMLFANAMTCNQPIKVFNHGNMSRDFTYIDDIVKGVVGVIDNPATSNPAFDGNQPMPNTSSAPYAIYNIGNNSPVSLLDFIKTMENAFGVSAQKIMMDMQPGDVASTYADSSQLASKIGFLPDTKLAEGIEKFAVWYKSFYL